METRECLRRIINALSEQGYVFSNGVQLYYCNPDNLKQIEDKFVEPLTLSRFQGDMYSIARELPEILLFPWRYIAPKPIFHSILGETQGILSVVGIVPIQNLSQFDTNSVFNRFDDAVFKLLRKYPWNNDNGVTYGTLMLLFVHSKDTQRFNGSIRKNYRAHIFKNTIISTISIDCEAETLTQGRAGLCFKWNGGIDVSRLKEHVFNGICKNNQLLDKMIADTEEGDFSSGEV